VNKRFESQVRFAMAMAALVFFAESVAAQGQAMSVSLPAIHCTSKEHVVGFEIHIKSGRISQLPNVPIGWDVSVNNDPPWNATIKGSSTVGSAAVGSDFFRGFLVVEKDVSLGLPFDVRGEIVVTEDFVSERRIRFDNKDFVLRRAKAKKAMAQR
jgi:hypothetical protein